jgi:hypothetical protein
MCTHRGRKAAIALAGVAVLGLACAQTTETEPAVVFTTAAVVSDDSAVLEVAKARCRRADECNRLGNGRQFADRRQCIQAFLDKDAHVQVVRTCEAGVDKAGLDKCIADLAGQYCDADLGPVTAMPNCASYCAH